MLPPRSGWTSGAGPPSEPRVQPSYRQTWGAISSSTRVIFPHPDTECNDRRVTLRLRVPWLLRASPSGKLSCALVAAPPSPQLGALVQAVPVPATREILPLAAAIFRTSLSPVSET